MGHLPYCISAGSNAHFNCQTKSWLCAGPFLSQDPEMYCNCIICLIIPPPTKCRSNVSLLFWRRNLSSAMVLSLSWRKPSFCHGPLYSPFNLNMFDDFKCLVQNETSATSECNACWPWWLLFLQHIIWNSWFGSHDLSSLNSMRSLKWGWALVLHISLISWHMHTCS